MNRSDNNKKAAGRAASAEKKTDNSAELHAAKTAPGGAPRSRSGAREGMSPELQAHIGRHVRAVFDEVAQEPIPDHLLRLLKDLDRSGDK
ncbi:MAG: NepR family anti-sigma factor [Methyloceanibacter sp.]|uniref:NepR family anti-sigma factor n=1 Tax=Methyloceanibacter sp. TaxID=1965321 RepID=UPI003D6D0CD3